MTQTITVKMDKDSEYYFVDASASDQGAVDASYDSAKDLIDAIGTSKSATLVFSHSGGGNTTTYTFSTSETIPDNFDVVVESGAIIVVATGITVTCNATFNASLQQCFSLTGTGKWAFGIGAVDKVYPQWWGALADDSNDDTAEIQAAADSITYGIVFFMGGTYKITTQIEITTKKVLSGADRTTTFIKLYTAAQHGIYINTDGQVTVENLSITAGITKGAGAGIYVTDSSTNNGWSLFNNLQLVAQYIGIDFVKAALWTMRNCYIVNSVAIGVRVANTYSVDTGDSLITNCIFDESLDAGTAIEQNSSGGLKIIGNKILNHAIAIDLDPVGSSSILLIQGNSIENQGTSGIVLQRTGGAATWSDVMIVGNHFANNVHAIAQSTDGWLSRILIVGNIINLVSGTNYGVNLAGADEGIISGNMFMGNGGAPVGIAIAVTSARIVVGMNYYYNLTTNVSNLSTTSNGEVSFGADGSAGTVYRLLRVPNVVV